MIQQKKILFFMKKTLFSPHHGKILNLIHAFGLQILNNNSS